MDEKNGVNLSDYCGWKNTPAGPALDTGFSDFIIAKILEETDNEKAKDVFETLRDVRNYIDDNIIAH